MTTPEIIALDGEGVTREDGSHEYVLLCASDGTYIESWAPGGLSTRDCFEFILDLAGRHRGAVLVIYGGGYDYQMMLRDLLPGCRQPCREADHPVPAETKRTCTWHCLIGERYLTLRTGGRCYRLRALMRHVLYVARGQYAPAQGGRSVWQRDASCQLWDVLGWYQSSFADAVERAGLRDDVWLDRLRGLKDQRPEFARFEPETIRAYCLDECQALAEMMAQTVASLAAAGIRPARWDGAGAGAAALCRSHHVDLHITRTANGQLEDAILRAYVGGRTQTFGAGILEGETYNYDLSSAYPREIAELPSLHGTWEHTGAMSIRPPGTRMLYRVRWQTDASQLTGLPYRQRGEISWPMMGEGWYWDVEAETAIWAAPGTYEIVDSWLYTPPPGRPFGWIDELVGRREALKLAGDPSERPLQMTLRAIYGKLVQARRQGKVPSYQSYVWGGMVTAAVRARVLEKVATVPPGDLVAIATDGLFSGTRLVCGDRWRETVIDPGLCVVQPGVMLTPDGGYLRSRGFGRTSISYGELTAAWRRDKFSGMIETLERRFVTAQWAEWRGMPRRWRRWEDVPRSIGYASVPRGWPRNTYWASARRLWEPLDPPSSPEAPWGVSEPYQPRGYERLGEERQYEDLCRGQPEVLIDTGVLR